jgi:hypothetical protein
METPARARWLSTPVVGIGFASFLSDLGHEVPTALLPSFLTVTLGAPAAALGLIEGIADGAAGSPSSSEEGSPTTLATGRRLPSAAT